MSNFVVNAIGTGGGVLDVLHVFTACGNINASMPNPSV
jgi:hypothetical protein